MPSRFMRGDLSPPKRLISRGGLVIPIIVLMVAAGCAPIQTLRKCEAGGCPDDARITAEVRSRLNQHPDLGAQVYVQTLDSVVSLTGQVTTALQRDAVEAIAHGVPGVRGVNDDVVVTADSGR
jgi:hypothetical protein